MSCKIYGNLRVSGDSVISVSAWAADETGKPVGRTYSYNLYLGSNNAVVLPAKFDRDNPLDRIFAVKSPYAGVYSDTSLTRVTRTLVRNDRVIIEKTSNPQILYVEGAVLKKDWGAFLKRPQNDGDRYELEDGAFEKFTGYMYRSAFELPSFHNTKNLAHEIADTAHSRLGVNGLYDQDKRAELYYADCSSFVYWAYRQYGFTFGGNYTAGVQGEYLSARGEEHEEVAVLDLIKDQYILEPIKLVGTEAYDAEGIFITFCEEKPIFFVDDEDGGLIPSGHPNNGGKFQIIIPGGLDETGVPRGDNGQYMIEQQNETFSNIEPGDLLFFNYFNRPYKADEVFSTHKRHIDCADNARLYGASATPPWSEEETNAYITAHYEAGCSGHCYCQWIRIYLNDVVILDDKDHEDADEESSHGRQVFMVSEFEYMHQYAKHFSERGVQFWSADDGNSKTTLLSGIDHVGMAIGDGQMIHATAGSPTQSSPTNQTVIESITPAHALVFVGRPTAIPLDDPEWQAKVGD